MREARRKSWYPCPARRIAKALTFAAMGFWVPQIVHCARHNARQPLRPPYVLGMSLTRLALPLYLFGCPRNVLHVGHAPALCVVLCVWMALQVWVTFSLSPSFPSSCHTFSCHRT